MGERKAYCVEMAKWIADGRFEWAACPADCFLIGKCDLLNAPDTEPIQS